MDDQIKDTLHSYIVQEFVRGEEYSHFSYCMYPEEACSCKNIAEITYDTSLLRGGYMDSFETTTLVVFIEAMFDIEVPNEDVIPANFDTITAMADYINKKRG